MTAHADDDSGDLSADSLPRKKFSGKKLVLFVILPLILLIAAGAGNPPVVVDETADIAKAARDIVWGASFDNNVICVDEKVAEAPPVDMLDPRAAPVFYELPDMLVNLNSINKRPAFLKIKIAIQVSRPEDIPAIEQVLPRIIDHFQVYLRELRLEDLKGSAGMYRLRQELLMRINAAAHPVKVRDVLFKEMLVQ